MVFQRLFKGGLFSGRIFGQDAQQRAAQSLYDAIVDQSRHTVLYSDFGVPDTFDGRFETLVLHVHLVVRRLTETGSDGAAVGQHLFDTLFHDMDRSLRAVGVGDMSVGKKVKQMGAAYFGRVAAYEESIGPDTSGDLATALVRNIYAVEQGTEPEESVVSGSKSLAAYVRDQVSHLSEQSAEHLIAGTVTFREPIADASTPVTT